MSFANLGRWWRAYRLNRAGFHHVVPKSPLHDLLIGLWSTYCWIIIPYRGYETLRDIHDEKEFKAKISRLSLDVNIPKSVVTHGVSAQRAKRTGQDDRTAIAWLRAIKDVDSDSSDRRLLAFLGTEFSDAVAVWLSGPSLRCWWTSIQLLQYHEDFAQVSQPIHEVILAAIDECRLVKQDPKVLTTLALVGGSCQYIFERQLLADSLEQLHRSESSGEVFHRLRLLMRAASESDRRSRVLQLAILHDASASEQALACKQSRRLFAESCALLAHHVMDDLADGVPDSTPFPSRRVVQHLHAKARRDLRMSDAASDALEVLVRIELTSGRLELYSPRKGHISRTFGHYREAKRLSKPGSPLHNEAASYYDSIVISCEQAVARREAEEADTERS
ncbi:hypothetical protein EXIGLDRAFT_728929 [Exidia glandulosa HHB12029]|uniref:Uncharacterized protein n=1 Tax=Exidia glandulosa HHB12029 TaxID=1314781 RepID=A0A166B5N7_EXIGL|nr:hypothetical protein EXIGLDRAFT_728929 [Exidia glandulosa HHB12029]